MTNLEETAETSAEKTLYAPGNNGGGNGLLIKKYVAAIIHKPNSLNGEILLYRNAGEKLFALPSIEHIAPEFYTDSLTKLLREKFMNLDFDRRTREILFREFVKRPRSYEETLTKEYLRVYFVWAHNEPVPAPGCEAIWAARPEDVETDGLTKKIWSGLCDEDYAGPMRGVVETAEATIKSGEKLR